MTEAHWFDNVAWFNKELTDSSLFLAIALPLLASAPAKQEKLLALYKTLSKAQGKANYHCDDFVKPFAPKVVKVAAKGKKAGATAKKAVSAKGKAPAKAKPTTKTKAAGAKAKADKKKK